MSDQKKVGDWFFPELLVIGLAVTECITSNQVSYSVKIYIFICLLDRRL
jgi:hypothetical protein